jgi:glycosyltransferase involved in cell wall biosynthesis
VKKRRVLYVAHGHPALRKGGGEQHALELYEAVQARTDFEPVLLAWDSRFTRKTDADSVFRAIDNDPGQVLCSTANYDQFRHACGDKTFLTIHFDAFLRQVQPDVVHFQHYLHLGVDAIRQVRATLPGVPIVLTLHEYTAMCHANGHMVRAGTSELCERPAPLQCHQCFPNWSAGEFLLRERLIRSNLSFVDAFIAPSRTLLERFVEWGIPREKILELDYGRPSPDTSPPEPAAPEGQVTRIGYFGQLSPAKGVLVLLRAMIHLEKYGVPIHLYVNGANLDLQTLEFRREYHSLLRRAGESVTDLGPYSFAAVARRMSMVDWIVVPSVWWENSPMVIQEAFLHRRPVICSGVGGMAEKVIHDRSGLHFRAGDALDLAGVLQRVVENPGLLERLRSGIPAVPRMVDAIERHTMLYRSLLEHRISSRGPS